jgi:hypothetical protein
MQHRAFIRQPIFSAYSCIEASIFSTIFFSNAVSEKLFIGTDFGA